MGGWLWPATSILLLAFAQNVSFAITSRSRNRSNITYHLIAATASNSEAAAITCRPILKIP